MSAEWQSSSTAIRATIAGQVQAGENARVPAAAAALCHFEGCSCNVLLGMLFAARAVAGSEENAQWVSDEP